MKMLILFACLLAIVFACSDSEKKEAAPAATAGVNGEKVYKSYCVTCHGIAGDMGASGAFNLTTSALSVEERVNVITNGRNAMTPFKDLLTPEKIQAVAEYTMKLKK